MPTRVHVIDSHERFSEFTMSDGTVIMAKLSFGVGTRLDTHDGVGNPQYAIENAQLLFAVKSCPEELRPVKQ